MGYKQPWPEDAYRHKRNIEDGTSCLAETGRPGATGQYILRRTSQLDTSEYRLTQFGHSIAKVGLHVNHSRLVFFYCNSAKMNFTADGRKLADAGKLEVVVRELALNKRRDGSHHFWRLDLKGLESGNSLLAASDSDSIERYVLAIDIADEVILPDANTDEGAIARLLIHEARTPFHPLYDFEVAKTCMAWMRIVLNNRRFGRFDLYGFKKPPTLLEVLHAKGQFGGFEDYPKLAGADLKNINDCLQAANDDSLSKQPEFAQHVEAAITIAKAKPQPDPSKNGLYGWRTQGSLAPGGYQTKYQDLGGLTFYTHTIK